MQLDGRNALPSECVRDSSDPGSSEEEVMDVAVAMTRKARTCTTQSHKPPRTSGVGRTAKAMPVAG